MGIQLKCSNEPGRNDLCPCQSGLKYKRCHGDEAKKAICNQVANQVMCQLIDRELKKREVEDEPEIIIVEDYDEN